MKRAVLGIVAFSALLTLGPAFAHAKTSTPVWVDSTGKQLGRLGFSGSIAPGVVLQVAPFPNFSIWLLVPFGVEGTGYATYVSPTYGPGMLGDQQFFTTTNCQGTAYALSPSPRQLARNSERHPYPAFMGVGGVVYFPIGTPQLGTSLGIVASSTYPGLPGLGAGIPGPCLPALAALGEYFDTLQQIGLGPEYFSNEGFVPPWSLRLP
jgi:hypothetical protein